MSEIDDIFASKGKAKVTAAVNPSSSKNLAKKSKKKKSKAARADDAKPAVQSAASASSSRKRPAPETVIDTSENIAGPSKRHKGDPENKSKSAQVDSKLDEKNADFKDSRGSSSRKKTEEGWSVYKEAELGIGDEGGDTPLCPFDCDCCF